MANWQLILQAARELTAARRVPFTRADVYQRIWASHPQADHPRPSLDPVFQGMTAQGTGGNPSPAGKPLQRVGHGLYMLQEAKPGSQPVAQPMPVRASRTAAGSGDGHLSEDEVKQGVKQFLEDQGFQVSVAWGHDHGVDIEASGAGETLRLEAKGSAANPPQQVNYFLGALGELLQRMTEPRAVYGLALPDHIQYRRLVSRLPSPVWQRLNLTVMFVSRAGDGGYKVDRVSEPSQSST